VGADEPLAEPVHDGRLHGGGVGDAGGRRGFEHRAHDVGRASRRDGDDDQLAAGQPGELGGHREAVGVRGGAHTGVGVVADRVAEPAQDRAADQAEADDAGRHRSTRSSMCS
jgi:hypothetical protein